MKSAGKHGPKGAELHEAVRDWGRHFEIEGLEEDVFSKGKGCVSYNYYSYVMKRSIRGGRLLQGQGVRPMVYVEV